MVMFVFVICMGFRLKVTDLITASVYPKNRIILKFCKKINYFVNLTSKNFVK